MRAPRENSPEGAERGAQKSSHFKYRRVKLHVAEKTKREEEKQENLFSDTDKLPFTSSAFKRKTEKKQTDCHSVRER